jgi:hypothetical protein
VSNRRRRKTDGLAGSKDTQHWEGKEEEGDGVEGRRKERRAFERDLLN